MRPIIAIVGPTATGKTAVAVEVARRLGGEVISADSGAVYRGLDIGTAKPSRDQRRSLAFHLLDVAEPAEGFSVARFKECAECALLGIAERRAWPILCGGTGLYVRALLDDLGLTETARDEELRARLIAEARTSGAAALHARLQRADPETAAKVHPNDLVRIVRALEIMAHTGRAVSVVHAEDTARRRARPAMRFALCAPRDDLDRRIDDRVDAMLQDGLVAEVEGLLAGGAAPSDPGMRVLGYKEIVSYVLGECDLDAAVALMKRNTRRFAKRQMTWFRADHAITWFDVTEAPVPEIADRIVNAATASDHELPRTPDLSGGDLR